MGCLGWKIFGFYSSCDEDWCIIWNKKKYSNMLKWRKYLVFVKFD